MSTSKRQALSFVLILSAVALGIAIGGSLGIAIPTQAKDTGPITPHAAVGSSAPALPSFANLAEAVDPAVISVESSRIQQIGGPHGGVQGGGDPFGFFFGPRNRNRDEEPRQFRSDSGGTGFLISADGLIVTNNHVIRDADEIRVRIGTHTYIAEVRGADTATDLALLKISADEDLPYLALGDSDALRPGDWVMAVGDPLQLENTVTVGVVSAKGRQINISRETQSFENFIQTDAAINFGNSGGPLLNLRGEVIGINTAINAAAENIGFAVPVNTLKSILPQLREHGRVRRGYLGIGVQNLDYVAAEAYGLDVDGGVLINRVIEGEPAERAGLKHADIILSVDGLKVGNTRQLIDYVSAQGPDATVVLEVLRRGKRIKKKVNLTERDAEEQVVEAPEKERERGIEWLGIRYQDLSSQGRTAHGLPDGLKGVWVTQVSPTSPLYDQGLRAGDQVISVITEVNDEPVSSVEDLERLVGEAQSGSRLRIYAQSFAPAGPGGEMQSFPLWLFPLVP